MRTENAPSRNDRSVPPQGVNGVLAGQVIDGGNRRANAASISVTEIAEGGQPGSAPIEVATDSQGYFTIQGLQVDRRYQLTARARDGGMVLMGSTMATPPDPKIVIRVSENFVVPTLPVSGNASAPAANNPTPTAPPPPSWPGDPSDRAWEPGRSTPPPPANTAPRAAELRPPVGARPAPSQPLQPTLSPPSTDQQPQVDRTRIAEGLDGNGLARNDRPSIPTFVPSPALTNDPLQRPMAPLRYSTGPARLPSCDLTGQTLNNFALNDLNGQPWEFRNHRGRLVLIDFWGTWCVHCLHSIPHLNILQERYGPYGLEVIGIAYEEGTPSEKARKVTNVSQRLHINYRQLLGGDRDQCPVRTQFAVRQWPTAVLLDESGRILWRGEGLDAQNLKELEIIIRQKLRAQ